MELFTTLEIIRMCIRFVPLMLAIIAIYKLKQIEKDGYHQQSIALDNQSTKEKRYGYLNR